MKKLIAISMAAILVLALGASAMAVDTVVEEDAVAVEETTGRTMPEKQAPQREKVEFTDEEKAEMQAKMEEKKADMETKMEDKKADMESSVADKKVDMETMQAEKLAELEALAEEAGMTLEEYKAANCQREDRDMQPQGGMAQGMQSQGGKQMQGGRK